MNPSSVFPASKPSAHLGPRFKNLGKRILLGSISSVLGVLLLLILAIAETIPEWKIVVEFLKLFAKAVPVLNLITYAGIPMIAGGIGLIAYSIWQFKRGARMTTAEETIKSFYEHGVLDPIGCYEIAWNCLTPEAKAQFGAIEDFENHWKELREEFIERKLAFMNMECIQNVAVIQKDENSCTVNFDIVAHDPGSVWRGPFHMKRFRFHQTATLCKSEGNWCLTSGKVDLSVSNCLPYAPFG